MADTSTNLSKIAREQMVSTLTAMKEMHPDQIEALNQVITFIKSQKYGLNFEKHIEQVDIDLQDHLPVFKPFKQIDAGDPDDGYNFLLEGDNLHSLKLLEKTHKGRIDVCTVDPPYNTLHEDFIYGDKMLSEDDGFVHSKWLSFMSERLEIAKELLTDTGVIFINIDEHEFGNLTLLARSVFGENNVETIIWSKVSKGGTAGTGKMKITNRFRNDHEYIVVCYKNKALTFFDKPLKLPAWETTYPNKDNDPRGPWCDGELCKSEVKSVPGGKNYYSVTTPDGSKTYTRQWHVSKEEFESLLNDTVVTEEENTVSRIWWGKTGNNCPRIKKFQNLPMPTTPTSVIKDISQTEGNNDLNKIFSEEKKTIIFDNPKPVLLIKELLRMIKNRNCCVLDFFAGSGTTGQAVLELNREDGGNRKFILCTNNEISGRSTLEYLHVNGYMIGYNPSVTTKNVIIKNKIDAFFGKNPDIYQKLIVLGKDAYETYGICQNVTFHRIKTVITGFRSDGSKYSDGIPCNLKYFQTDMVDKYERDGEGSCLPYISETLRADLSSYIDTLIELQDGISLPSKKTAVIWDSVGIDELIEADITELQTVYMDIDTIETTAKQERFIERLRNRGVVFRNIPKYYYKEVQ